MSDWVAVALGFGIGDFVSLLILAVYIGGVNSRVRSIEKRQR